MLDPISHIKKLTNTNFLLVDESFSVIQSGSSLLDDFTFSDFFYSNSKPFQNLKGVTNGYEKLVSLALDGHFQIENFKDSRVFFIPFLPTKQVLIYTEKLVDITEKKRISDNEFNDNQPIEILLKLDKNGIVLAAEDHHFYYFNTQLVGQEVFDLFAEEDKKTLIEGIDALYKDQDALNIKLSSVIHNQQVYFIGVLVRGREDRLILILRDDTERLNREFELNLKNKAIEYSPIGTYVIDYQDMYFLYANDAYYQITGFSSNQITGGDISLFDEPYTNLFFVDDEMERERYAESIRLKQRYEGIFLCSRLNGEAYWNSMVSIPVIEEESGKTIFVGIVKDVTEEKATNQRLIKAIINTQEQERSRFSLDLHDGLGQKLLAAKMNLLALEEYNCFTEESELLYKKSVDLLMDAIRETRSISHSLMSHTLKGFGLGRAVEEMIQSFSAIASRINFQNLIKDKRYDIDIEVGIFRIIQELLNNAIKHAKANSISIRIVKTNKNNLLVEFKDDGVGFNKEIVLNKKGGGIGIRNIKTRILFLGGQLYLNTELGNGCNYQIYIPFEKKY